MCVAIYKPKDVLTPSLEVLKKCWQSNPDGAGFAMREKGKIFIHKGFMFWEDFVKAYQSYNLANIKDDLLIHFRIATHGGIKAGNTHPFAITEKISTLQSLDVLSDYALIHNGVLPITPSNKNISDTMEFCKLVAKGNLHHQTPQLLKLLDNFIGNNKIAIMTNNDVFMAGDWECINGIYFSNSHWNYFFDDWEDYPLIADDFELEFLNQGYCPNCDSQICKDDDEYYCLSCEGMWSVQKKERFSERLFN